MDVCVCCISSVLEDLFKGALCGCGEEIETHKINEVIQTKKKKKSPQKTNVCIVMIN